MNKAESKEQTPKKKHVEKISKQKWVRKVPSIAKVASVIALQSKGLSCHAVT